MQNTKNETFLHTFISLLIICESLKSIHLKDIDFKLLQMISHDMKLCKKVSVIVFHIFSQKLLHFVCIFLHKYCVHNSSYSFKWIEFKLSQMVSHEVNVYKKVSFLACHVSPTSYSPFSLLYVI